jgi:hypothetical protein
VWVLTGEGSEGGGGCGGKAVSREGGAVGERVGRGGMEVARAVQWVVARGQWRHLLEKVGMEGEGDGS